MTGGRTGSFAPKLVAAVAAATAALTLASPVPAVAHERDGAGEQRRHVARRARSQIDAPYRYGGSSPGGFDCSGFTTWVFDDHGAELPRSSMDQYELGARDGYRRVRLRKNLKKGDLVFHKTTSATVGHVGIYLGDGDFISATSSQGVQVRSLYDPYYWGERWVGGVRLPTTRAR
ncbi:MAG TPA: C40 family peptidase [Actinomycetota bacterium]|nr:C40 family peptidase [Actinomycetota bacterium]